MALDLEPAGDVVELLAHILANALQRRAATADGAFGLMMYVAPRQVRRQGVALGLVPCRAGRIVRTQSSELRRERLEISRDRVFEQVALRAMPPLAPCRKLPALEKRPFMRELVDLELLVTQLRILPARRSIRPAAESRSYCASMVAS